MLAITEKHSIFAPALGVNYPLVFKARITVLIFFELFFKKSCGIKKVLYICTRLAHEALIKMMIW